MSRATYLCIVFILAAALTASAGCRKNNITGRYTEILQHHIGSPIKSLVGYLGVPSGSFENDDGTVYYEWSKQGRAWEKWVGNYWGECTTSATTDAEGIVIDYDWKGNACGQL